MATNAGPKHGPSIPGLQEEFEQFRRNLDYINDEWSRFLDEHAGEWVLVYEEQQTAFGPDVTELVGRLSPDQRSAAAVRYVQKTPPVLFL